MKRFGIMLMAKKIDGDEGSGGGKGKSKTPPKVETPPESEDDEEEESGEEESEEEEEESEEESEGSEESEETEEEEEEFDEENLRLLRALQNPATRARALRQIAKDAKEEIQDGTPKGKVKGAWKAALSASLGKDFAAALVPLLEEAINEGTEELRSALSITEQRHIVKESQRAEKQFYTDFPDARKIEKKILTVMSKYPPDPGLDPYDYMVDMYTIAGGGKAKKSGDPNEARRQQRIKDNQKEQGIPASGKASTTVPQKGVKGKLSLREAVQLASQGKTVG